MVLPPIKLLRRYLVEHSLSTFSSHGFCSVFTLFSLSLALAISSLTCTCCNWILLAVAVHIMPFLVPVTSSHLMECHEQHWPKPWVAMVNRIHHATWSNKAKDGEAKEGGKIALETEMKQHEYVYHEFQNFPKQRNAFWISGTRHEIKRLCLALTFIISTVSFHADACKT